MTTHALPAAPAALPVPRRGALSSWLLVSLAHVVAQVATHALVPLSDALRVPDEQATASAVALLAVSAAEGALLTAVVRRSAVGGWPLVGALVVTWWGLATFMTQIETAWFLGAFPSLGGADLARLFVSGLVFAVLWIPAGVWAAGGLAPRGAFAPLARRGLAPRLAALGPLYAALYFTFGYHVAWQWQEVRVFYAGHDAVTSFTGQLASVAASDPWLFPFQVLRGVLWAAWAAPAVALFRERREAVVAVGLLCALAPTVQLLYPNVLMPPPVRLAHFVEVSTSTGLFGVAAALLLRRR